MTHLTTRLVILLAALLMAVTGAYDYHHLVQERDRAITQAVEGRPRQGPRRGGERYDLEGRALAFLLLRHRKKGRNGPPRRPSPGPAEG